MQSSHMGARVGVVVTGVGLLFAGVSACSNGSASNGGGNGSGGGSGTPVASAGTAGTPSSAGTKSSSSGAGGAASGVGGSTTAGQSGTAGATTGGAAGATTPSSGGVSGTTSGVAGGTSGGSAGITSGGGAPPNGGAGGTSGSAGSGAAGAASGGAAGSSATANWCLPISAHPQGVDWAKALVDSQIKANPTLDWEYPNGLFLHGVYLAYKRLNDASYLSFIKKWADANTAGQATYDSLDNMQPTLVLDDMFRETMDEKYKAAPVAAAARLETGNYPTTSDGGFWHNTGATQQLWGDGVFMDLPPLVNQGALFNDKKAIDIATQQLIIYDSHIAAPNNLHVHNWDGTITAQPAANRTKGQACCEWCRAEGWYEMALLIVLDFAGPTHKDYAALVAIAQRLAKGVAATQDSATGRWWQVMDTPTDSGNWLETSCTAMHTYFLSKASQLGYIDAATYGPLAIKGFNGEMQMVSNQSSVQIKNICPGTGVLATAADYYARPPATNDNHGLGAFLLMYDQLTCR